MKKTQIILFYMAVAYMSLGLMGGLYYRELTKSHDFPASEFTQLSVVHTHLFALGFIVSLVLLALDKLFGLSNAKSFRWGLVIYNVGIITTVGVMVWHGTLQVLGQDGTPAISGIAGLGHIFLTLALILIMLALGSAVHNSSQARQQDATVQA